MEEKFILRTEDNHNIYGTVNFAGSTVIIFVHGFGSNSGNQRFTTASYFFPKNGISVIKFNLHDKRDGGRVLEDTTLAMNSKDIDDIILLAKERFSRIILVGHSFGAPAALMSKKLKYVSKIILWDPSLKLKNIKRKIMSEPSKMRDIDKEIERELDTIDTLQLIEKSPVPVKVILAGDGPYIGSKDKVDSIIIPHANHRFNTPGSQDILFKETLKEIKK